MNGWTSVDYLIFTIAAMIAVSAFLKLLAVRRAVLLSELENDIVKEQQTPM